MNINVLAKSDEIPSLPVQDIKEKPKCCGQRIQRAIYLTESAPSPYFSIINVHLVDINVFAKSDEIPSLPFQVIKEKPKCRGLRLTKGNNLKNWTLALFFLLSMFINVFAKGEGSRTTQIGLVDRGKNQRQ